MGELSVAVYARTSSDQQSIGQQLAELRGRIADDQVRVPAEREFVDDMLWWTLEELAACAEPVFPPGLAERLERLLAAKTG